MRKMPTLIPNYSMKCFITVALICVTHTGSDNPASQSNEITYQSNAILSLQCLNSPTAGTQPHVTWHIEGVAISSEILEVPGWSVQSTPSSVHENSIKLRSTSTYSRTYIVHCTIEGKYRDNIVNIYKLNKQIPRDTFPLIHNHPQRCPLFVSFKLTLTCAVPILSPEVYDWYWEKDGGFATHGPSLDVSEPGNYACFYKHHRSHASHVLSFVVERQGSPSRQPPPQWVYCKYTVPAKSDSVKTTARASSGSSLLKVVPSRAHGIPILLVFRYLLGLHVMFTFVVPL